MHLYSLYLIALDKHQFHDPKGWIILIVIGFLAGLFAQMILPGRGFGMLSTVIIGVAGAWLGSKYIKAYITFIDDPFFRHIAAAIVGAMILCLLINLIRGGNDRDKTSWRHG